MFALAVYMLFGLALAWRILPSCRVAVKCWLGLVFGSIALMWLPCLFAIFLGFTKTAQSLALGLAAAGAVGLLIYRQKPGDIPAKIKSLLAPPPHRDLIGLLLSGLAAAFCGYLLHTHVLLPHADGSLWVGQSTYGDLALHLGLIENLFQEGKFPPDYNIYPGQLLDYPFLADAASASLRFWGMSLRMSAIVPSLIQQFAVFFGFWLLADKLTGRLGPTLAAWLLFTCNGGFGFILFFSGKYSFAEMMSGFYVTPTNLIGENIRWVNVICDMLIPQRTTGAGWCVVLSAIYLLITVLEKSVSGQSCRREAVALAVIAGAMPMIHTHSFLTLGILSAVWFFLFLPQAKKAGHIKDLVMNYVLYGVICFALALPQLFTWAFHAAGSGRFIWWNPGWIAEGGWLRFWIMNGGVVFVLMWPMAALLRGDRARIFWGAAAVFLIANFVEFQPNPYDNNKLMYIWYMLTDIMVCVWLWELLDGLRRPAVRKAIAACIVVLGTLSGMLTMLREAAGEYQFLSGDQAAAGAFIEDNTPADSLFLTATTSHINPVSILAGRNVLCGSPTFLYYHGIDYGQREADVAQMYQGGETFIQLAAQYGVDYVYIGDTEYAAYPVDYGFFAENYPLVYTTGNISIFQISS